MAKDDIYEDIVRRIRYSEGDFRELEKVKHEISTKFLNVFNDYIGFKGLKFIGACATGNCVKWKKDIDGIVILNPISVVDFRRMVNQIGGLEDIVFANKCFVVKDKFDAKYYEYDVSIGCVDGSLFPSNDLGADLSMHPDFTLEKLSREQKKEVILTKIFLKNIGLYGKKIGGFATEQIIIHFGSFDNFLEHLRTGKPIFIDFSGRYSGKSSPVIVSYPYCGLENLAKVSQEHFERAVQYAREITDKPKIFLEDSCSTVNRLFWEKRANLFENKEELSTPDIYLNHKENRIFRKKISSEGSGLRVLDIGCANGYSIIAINRGGENYMVGIDKNQRLIETAKKLASQNNVDNIEFIVSDMPKLPFDDLTFDIIYAKRSISNLPSRDKQGGAIQEIKRVIKKNGLFLLSDLFEEGYGIINKWRIKLNLEQIRFPYHINLLNEPYVFDLVSENFDLEEVYDFSSSYYFLSRVIYPKVMDITKGKVKSDSNINRLFSMLPSIGKIGMNKIFVLRENGS